MWFPIALVTAFTDAITDLISKHQVKSIHPVVTLFLNLCFAFLFMGIIVFFTGGFPHVTKKFYLFMFLSSILDVFAFISGYWAMRHTQLSLLAPLASLTPIVATFFGYVLLHEVPTPVKLLGILTIVSGVYLLNVAEIKGGLLKPFAKLFSDRGVKIFFIQVFLWGLTPIFQKQAIFETNPINPIFASFFGFFLVLIFLSFYALRNIKNERSALKEKKWQFVIFGGLYAISQLSAYTVFSLTNVGYATAIFSLSSLITITLAGVLFKETHIKERLLGTTIIIAGVVLLAM